MHTLLATLGLALTTQSPPAEIKGHGHEAPKTAKPAALVLGPIGAPPSIGQIKDTADIGLKLPPAERRMRMVVNNTTIQDALKMVSDVGEIRIETSEDVKGTVSLKLEDVHWNEAFYAVLKAKKLGFERQGGLVIVQTLKEMRDRAKSRPRALSSDKLGEGAAVITVLLPVKFATPDELLPIVRSMLSSRGTVAVDKRSNTLIVTDIAAEEIRTRFVL